MALVLMFVVLLTALSTFAAKNISGTYALYEVMAYNYRERAFLYSLHVNYHEYFFMNGVTNEAAIPMYVIVDQCCSETFEKGLYANNLDFSFLHSGVLWDDFNITETTIPLNTFYNYYKIEIWLELKAKKHSMLEKLVIGHTYEDREIIVLKMSVGRRKCAILVVGGEEGRDWMSPAIIMNFIVNILENKGNVNKLIQYCEFYFLPVFNPDGYDHSIKKDMFWTKNRKIFFLKKICNGKTAIGVNIDRNWFFTKASNLHDDECKAVYPGEKPISEEEPQALFQFMNSIANNLMIYINVRSFERVITVPYGYTTMFSNNHLILMEILSSTCEQLYKKHNATYFYGNTANILFNFSGNSADWVKEHLNIPIVLTVYLKYKDYLMPNKTHIKPLTDQFTTIIAETLPVVYSIYGPLFNHVSQSKFTYILIMYLILYFVLIQ